MNKRYRIAVILVLSISWQLPALCQETPGLDSIFKDWTNKTPGGVICVVHHGRIVYKKAFGLANLKTKLPNSPDLKFDIASNAKQFTGMCIALLEEQGKLSLEDDLKKYYPGLKINEQIKIKNLLDHTSGLRDASVLAILSGKMNLKGGVRKKYDTKQYYLECLMRETDLNYKPGSEWAYTNFNYVLLGDIVEKVSGQSLSAFSDSAIFKPLGMTNTLWRDSHTKSILNEAPGYLFRGNKAKVRKPVPGIVGDHNLLSTADDLAKYEINFYHNKLGKQEQALITRISTSSKLNSGNETGYGFGVWTNTYKGVKHIAHGGDDGGHTSGIIRFPDHELSIIILANSSRYKDTETKAYQVADVLLKAHLKQPEVKKEKEFEFITVADSALRSKAGLYTMIDERGLGQLAKITYDKGELYASRNYFWKGLKLSAISTQDYIGTNPEGEIVKVGFVKEGGQSYLTELFRDYPMKRYALLKEKPINYSDFAGRYENESTGAKILIRKKNKKIVARKGILKIALISFSDDMFYAPDNHALFIFDRDAKGKVISFKANAPDFRNFIFIRK